MFPGKSWIYQKFGVWVDNNKFLRDIYQEMGRI